MDKNEYVRRMQQMINKGREDGFYGKAEDITLQDLTRSQDFLLGNFSRYERM